MKRAFDIICSILIGLLLMPVWLSVSCLVWWVLGKPVLFRQQRAGLKGKPFIIYKFRTMSPEHDRRGNRIPDDARTGKLGRFLRASSLDELPEIWNVIKGDMSLVGPRPLFLDYLPYYTEDECRRHDARPGITGLAQVNGRNTAGWQKKLSMDVFYVDNRSFLLDVKILFLTVIKVLMRSDLEVVPGGRGRLDDVRKRENAKKMKAKENTVG